MRPIPFYLQNKLSKIAINSVDEIITIGYLEIFAKLKANYPSVGYQALFDLYTFVTNQTYPDKQLQTKLIADYKQLPPQFPQLDNETINNYLMKAMELAQNALAQNEIPIGAIVVYQDKIIGRGYNQTRQQNNILAHAELIAINEAQTYLGNHRLNDCDLYVTVEPCLMCSGAIIHSRIKRVIFGAIEPKTGACQSQYSVFTNSQVNHHCQIIGPIDNERYAKPLAQIFTRK